MPVHSDHDADRAHLLEIVRERALRQFDEPKELASGELSRDFIDAKAGLSRGRDLRLACAVIAEQVAAALAGGEHTNITRLTIDVEEMLGQSGGYARDIS